MWTLTHIEFIIYCKLKIAPNPVGDSTDSTLVFERSIFLKTAYTGRNRCLKHSLCMKLHFRILYLAVHLKSIFILPENIIFRNYLILDHHFYKNEIPKTPS
jgi:hypothetical protein